MERTEKSRVEETRQPLALIVATYFCDRCNRALGEAETKQVRAGSGWMRTCVACGGLARDDAPVASRPSRPLALEMVRAYAFPFRASSIAMLAPLGVLTALSAMSIYALLANLVCHAVVLAAMFAIVRETTRGADEITIDSMVVHRGEAAVVVVRYLFLALVCAAPLLVAWWLGLGPTAYVIALIAGYLYFPAGLIAASQEAATFWDPLVGYRVIAAMPASYFIAIVCLTPAAAIWFGAPVLAASAFASPRMAFVLEELLSVFAFAIVARICGVLLREEGYG